MRAIEAIATDDQKRFGVQDIIDAASETDPEHALTPQQVHNALKGLVSQSEVRRLNRGEYARLIRQPDEITETAPNGGSIRNIQQEALPMQGNISWGLSPVHTVRLTR